MKKILLLLIVSILGFALVWCSSSETENTSTNISSNGSNIDVVDMKPETPMDFYGKIISMEWNEFTIQMIDTTQDPTFGMTQEEKKEYKATLTDDQKMAEKDILNNSILGNVKITIPVGIPVSIKLEQWAEAPEQMWSLVDLVEWSYISVWYDTEVVDRKVAMYVKKSFTK